MHQPRALITQEHGECYLDALLRKLWVASCCNFLRLYPIFLDLCCDFSFTGFAIEVGFASCQIIYS